MRTGLQKSVRQHDRHLDLAARAQHLQRYLIAVAANPKIDAGRAKLQIAQHHLVEERRQARIAQADFAARASNSSPSAASSSVNGVALAHACGAQATG
jgi:hypothetical protein